MQIFKFTHMQMAVYGLYKKAGHPEKEPWFDYDPTLTACQNL